jgi:hypothetical protein
MGTSGPIKLENVGCCVPAKADIHIMNLVDNENGRTEPEKKLGDPGQPGELSQYMWITMTAYDSDGNWMWDKEGWLDLLNCQNFIIGDLNPGDFITVVIDWEVPAGTGNIIMTDTVTFDIEFSLDQTVGTPPDMSLTDITQPPTAIICDMVPITVDVTNSGQNTGSTTVTLDIDGWSQTKSVTVAGESTVTVTFEWHADTSGLKTVVASIPDDGGEVPHELECPGGIEVFAPPEFEGVWEPALPLEVYVCDTLTVGVVIENLGDVEATVDVTLTITVDGEPKFTDTKTVTIAGHATEVVTFEPWHVEDPVTMTGSLAVSIDGVPVPGLSATIDIIDEDPVVTEISPATCTNLQAPGSVTISARATDDGGVVGVGYTIDDPMGTPAPMMLVSGDPLDGIYESIAPWDYSGMSLGDHTIYVGAMDGAGNIGGNAAVVHVEGAVFTYSNLTVDPNPATDCDTVTVSVTVTNTGNASGTVTITVTVDGTSYTHTVTLAPDESYTFTFTFHAVEGTYTVAAPGLPPVELVVNPPGPCLPSVSTVWVYEATNVDPQLVPVLGQDYQITEWTQHVVAQEEVEGVLCYKVVTSFAGLDPPPDPENPPTMGPTVFLGGVQATIVGADSWYSKETLDTIVAVGAVDAFGLVIEATILNEYPGSHGYPWPVCTPWDIWSTSSVNPPLSPTSYSMGYVHAVGIETISVPAGTFDCVRLETTTTHEGPTPQPNTEDVDDYLSGIQWWSYDVCGVVKSVSWGYDGELTQELTNYTPGP